MTKQIKHIRISKRGNKFLAGSKVILSVVVSKKYWRQLEEKFSHMRGVREIHNESRDYEGWTE